MPFKSKKYFEFNLENIFYRKESKLEAYENESPTRETIDPNNQPVFSFRYKFGFNKQEEIQFKENKENDLATLLS